MFHTLVMGETGSSCCVDDDAHAGTDDVTW